MKPFIAVLCFFCVCSFFQIFFNQNQLSIGALRGDLVFPWTLMHISCLLFFFFLKYTMPLTNTIDIYSWLFLF